MGSRDALSRDLDAPPSRRLVHQAAFGGDILRRDQQSSDQRVLTELVTSLGQASSALEARAALDRALAR